MIHRKISSIESFHAAPKGEKTQNLGIIHLTQRGGIMIHAPVDSQTYQLHACLPFIELAQESVIQLGPVLFWPASKSEEFLPLDFHHSFQNYMNAAGQIKAFGIDSERKCIHTSKLKLEGMTCISILETVPKELREFLLIDSLYLLYFACTFRNLYYGQEILSFNAFRKMIPASSEFIQNPQNWENLYIHETDREEGICLNVIDSDICEGLGKALEIIYMSSSQDKKLIQSHKRLVRSIRYLVDRFFQRFVNLFNRGLYFSEQIFEPEDVIFLAASFETLFDINDKHPAADFKHKLRPLLHLKYSRPVEIFWKWVDDFYELKRRILYGETFLDPLFRLNPNFEISHIFLGIKLFVYAVYYNLFKHRLLSAIDDYSPPHFKWIYPEEILLFFWTESSLLNKLNLFLKQIQEEPIKKEAAEDIHLLTYLFVSLYERYYSEEQLKGQGIVRFLPTPVADLRDPGTRILENLLEKQKLNPEGTLFQVIHPDFIRVLQERLHN